MVTFNGRTDLLGAGGDGEEGLGLHAVFEGLVRDAGRPSHVLVAAVGAASNQTCRDTDNTNSVRTLVPAAQRYWVCLLAIMIMITISLVVIGKNQKRNITLAN